jgi:hypothetical protein
LDFVPPGQSRCSTLVEIEKLKSARLDFLASGVRLCATPRPLADALALDACDEGPGRDLQELGDAFALSRVGGQQCTLLVGDGWAPREKHAHENWVPLVGIP